MNNLRILILIILTLVTLSCNHSSQDNEVVVYTTMYGECYHSTKNCPTLYKSKVIFGCSESKAQQKGYRSCNVCINKYK